MGTDRDLSFDLQFLGQTVLSPGFCRLAGPTYELNILIRASERKKSITTMSYEKELAKTYFDKSIKQRDVSIKSPVSTITRHGRTGDDSRAGRELGAFTGEVWLDAMVAADGAFMSLVNFLPCSRTNWHRHDKGQLLKVVGGSGWYCDQGEQPRRIAVGDVIWCPPGVVHWHGADDRSYMIHEATSFGQVDWYETVSDREYACKDTK